MKKDTRKRAEKDLARLQKLVDRYRNAANANGVNVESVTIGEALDWLADQR